MKQEFIIWSDLHLDFYGREARRHIANLLIRAQEDHPNAHVLLAGDIAEDPNIKTSFFKALSEGQVDFTFCNGNHDYYRQEFKSDFGQTILDNGVKIAAGTLWTNFNNEVAFAQFIYNQINDPHKIIGARNAETLINAYYQQLEYFRRSDAPVIMTHFPMFRGSVAERFKYDALNSYFVNNVDPSIAIGRKLFVHGHVHDAFDYQVEDARVVCHPLGYPGEAQTAVQLEPKFVEIEIADGNGTD